MIAKWTLDIPACDLAGIINNVTWSQRPSFTEALGMPVVLVFTNKDNEWNIIGFASREAAKEHMEQRDSTSYPEGQYLEYALIEGKRTKWEARTVFDFVEVKK
jgi:hypothetical protein